MPGIRIFGILVGIYFMVQSYSLIKKRKEDIFSFFIWAMIGIGLVISGLFPNLFNLVAKFLTMEKRAYTMFSTGILFCLLLLFHLSNSIREIEKNLSKLNEELTFLKEEKKSKIVTNSSRNKS